jgi:hypothetical protein
MKVEVGDWVMFRGGRRIVEVQSTRSVSGEVVAVGFTHVNGRPSEHPVELIEKHAAKFWIKKAE